MSEFQTIVIGAGPAGVSAATTLAKAGQKTACVEADLLGGTCLNRGCIPTKVLLKSARVLDLVRRADEFGISVESAKFDFAKIRARISAVEDRLRKGTAFLLKKAGVEVIEARAKIADQHTVLLTYPDGHTESAKAEKIVLTCGCKQKKLPFADYSSPRIMTSENALALDIVPQSVAIVGAGAIGAEFAQIWSAFGSKVFLLEVAQSILPSEDRDASSALARTFKKRGIDIKTSAAVKSVRAAGEGVEIDFERDGKSESLRADFALVCAGIAPDIAEILGDGAQLKLDSRGFAEVDKNFRTSIPSIFAAGDIIGVPALAHSAEREGALAAEAVLNGTCEARGACPTCVYTSPEIASVGLSEKAAAEKFGDDAAVSKISYLALGRAVAEGETDGFVKLVYLKSSDKILGACAVGERAEDIVSEVALALKTGATKKDAASAMRPHPSFSEIISMAAKV